MITLDKWDSQILLLSKGWFKTELEDLGKGNLDFMKALWTDRCYVPLEQVETRILVGRLATILETLGLLNSDKVSDLLLETLRYSPEFNRYGYKRDEEVSREEDLINSLLSVISTVQVRKGNRNDGYEDIIKLEPKYTSYLEVFTRVEDEGIEV